MNYIVTKNALGHIVQTVHCSPVRLIADAAALQYADEYHAVEIWGGDEQGTKGAYAHTVFISGKRIT